MSHAEEAACRAELRRNGLPAQRDLARLLSLLRAAPESHLGLKEILRMAAETGIATTPVGLGRQLETLADRGLLGRVPTTAAEPVFDTVSEPHHHLVYEKTAQTIDLQVSAETLLAIVRQALNECPGAVDILIRFRANPMTTTDCSARLERLSRDTSLSPNRP